MQFPIRYFTLQTQQQAAIWSAGIIDAIAVGNKATHIATDIEQGIPVRAISRRAGHFCGQNDAHLSQGYPGGKVLESNVSLCGGAGGAQVRINENDISFIPANVKAALFESVLEALGFPD